MPVLTPFGAGTTAPSAAPPNLTEYPAGVRYLDPASGDYRYDTTSRHLAQMPSARQRVLLAVKQLRGSMSASLTEGIALPSKMGDTFAVELQQSIRAALAQLTDVEKLIRVDGIEVVHGRGGRGLATITYTDLTSGEALSETI